MSFGAPLAFGLLALALPVTILYVLKVRRRRVTVPYLRLWEQLVVESRARSLFQRLKRLFSLLLQLLILALLTLALARPGVDLSAVRKESIVLLLDASASMQAVEGDPGTGRTRFELMLERASELVEGRSFEDEMLIAAVSDRVDILTSFNRSTIQLRDALAGARQTNRSLDAARAYEFAREATAGREAPVIVFLSDGSGNAIHELIDGAEDAHLLTIGEAVENLGIVRFSARKNSSLGTDYVLAVVRNFGREPRECRLELSLDGRTQKVIPRTIAPDETITENFQLSLDEGGTLRLAVEASEPDALTIDDEAWAVVRPNRLRKVVLVTSEPFEAVPFMVAFQSMGEVIAAESFAATAAEYALLDDEAKGADVTLCVGVVPDGLPAQGNLVLMDTPLPDFLPATITGEEARPEVWDWDREHLLNRYMQYRGLAIPPARTVELRSGTALVSSYEGPLISAFELAARHAVYVAFDMTAHLFPFRLAFPMLLRNAIAWFEVEEDVLLEATYAPGDTIQPLRRLGDGAVQATWFEGGAQRTAEVPLRGGAFYFDRTESPGPYLFRVGARNHATSVNLFDAGESLIAPHRHEDEEAEDRSLAEAGSHVLNRDLWTLLALLALCVWGSEWALYHRRVTE